ncbi:hypothetical protein HID58_045906 [Brassica napus]|uniref:SRR1-like domain-containing protein n=1 Tax=Brassica napus TaxID=3708 RepID=A0ABQ8AV06_BRANA|nr:hypothetical protein HID58_045906 [Brassica napus]
MGLARRLPIAAGLGSTKLTPYVSLSPPGCLVFQASSSSVSQESFFDLPLVGRRKPKPKIHEEEEEEEKPWKSDDLEIDPQRQARVKQKMENSIKKVESSKFYTTFLEQLNIESYESPRFQLSIAILMKREFDWVGNIEVFDPVLSATESSVLESLGCTVLSVNEQARREALKPTLFFMPHCEANLYNNLLQANWRMDRLSKIALFGNSFQMYEEQVTLDPAVIRATKRIIAARRITSEFAIETLPTNERRQRQKSAHFCFCHDSQAETMSSGGFSQKKRRSNGFHIRPTNSGHGATFEFSLKKRSAFDASNVPLLDITTVNTSLSSTQSKNYHVSIYRLNPTSLIPLPRAL